MSRVTSTRPFLPVTLKCYIGLETEPNTRQLERYFKSGSGKAFAKKRFW
jgi:putative endonuclease